MDPPDVVFTKWDIVEPALLFVVENQGPILTEKNDQRAPALVVEIASTGTRRRAD